MMNLRADQIPLMRVNIRFCIFTFLCHIWNLKIKTDQIIISLVFTSVWNSVSPSEGTAQTEGVWEQSSKKGETWSISTRGEESYIMKGFIICTLHLILLDWLNQEGKIGGAFSMEGLRNAIKWRIRWRGHLPRRGGCEMHTKFRLQNLKGKLLLEDPGIGKVEAKWSRYTPWRRLVWEEV
jgi:hypothetical protein